MKSQCRFAASAVLLFFSLAINNATFANPFNTLDSVVVTGEAANGDDVAIVAGNGPNFELQFPLQNNIGTGNFTDCDATADGTFCIDSGLYIVDLLTWKPNDTSTALYTCEDLGFAKPKGKNPPLGNCTAITVANNATYIMGIRNKNGSAGVKVADFTNDGLDNDGDGQTDGDDMDGECAAGYSPVGATNLCSALLFQERPVIVDADITDIGLFFLENRDTINRATGLEPGNTTIEKIAGSKQLQLAKGKTKEEALNHTLITYLDSEDDPQAAIGVATSFGRLIVLGLDDNFSFDGHSIDRSLSISGILECPDPVGSAHYDVTQNITRGGPLFVSVSDTSCVHTFNLELDANDNINALALDQSVLAFDGTNTYTPLTVNVFEGVNVNFSNAAWQTAAGCIVGNGTTLINFNLVQNSEESGTLWEVRGIPHCAWNPFACIDLLGINPTGINDEADARNALCAHASGVLSLVTPAANLLDPDDPIQITTCGQAPPELLSLNATPLIPPNLIAQFDPASLPDGIFPDLIIPPDYQAQFIGSLGGNGVDDDGDSVVDDTDGSMGAPETYFFDALLFDAEGVQPSSGSEFTVDPDVIVGSPQLGCPADASVIPRSVETQMNTSIVVKVSERIESVSCDENGENCALDGHHGSMVTIGCFNPARNKDCCSLFPVNLQPTLRQPAQAGVNWFVDSQTDEDDGEAADDSSAAKLYDKLFAELLDAQGAACDPDLDGDPNGAPLSASLCSQLTDRWENAKSKLVTALSNTLTGDNCSGNSRNYQSHLSQLLNYRAQLESFEGNLPTCSDGIDNDLDNTADFGGIDGPPPLPADDDCDANVPTDSAGRHATAIGRTFVLEYVFNEMLLPSVPAACPDGWEEDDTSWIFD